MHELIAGSAVAEGPRDAMHWLTDEILSNAARV